MNSSLSWVHDLDVSAILVSRLKLFRFAILVNATAASTVSLVKISSEFNLRSVGSYDVDSPFGKLRSSVVLVLLIEGVFLFSLWYTARSNGWGDNRDAENGNFHGGNPKLFSIVRPDINEQGSHVIYIQQTCSENISDTSIHRI